MADRRVGKREERHMEQWQMEKERRKGLGNQNIECARTRENPASLSEGNIHN